MYKKITLHPASFCALNSNEVVIKHLSLQNMQSKTMLQANPKSELSLQSGIIGLGYLPRLPNLKELANTLSMLRGVDYPVKCRVPYEENNKKWKIIVSDLRK